MKYSKFLQIYKKVPIIDSSTFSLYSENVANLRRQVIGWVEKGYLIPLKRGVYIFNDNYRQVEPSKLFLANYMVSPSYVSLEYALGLYGLIPERVYDITSVTTKKTNEFSNVIGRFEYRKIKESLFFGFKQEKEKDQESFIAEPEKAFLDYFYLNHLFVGKFEEFKSMRFQNLENLNIKRLKEYEIQYNRRVNKVVNAFINYIQKYKNEYKTL